jgi:hypothetical protein
MAHILDSKRNLSPPILRRTKMEKQRLVIIDQPFVICMFTEGMGVASLSPLLFSKLKK